MKKRILYTLPVFHLDFPPEKQSNCLLQYNAGAVYVCIMSNICHMTKCFRETDITLMICTSLINSLFYAFIFIPLYFFLQIYVLLQGFITSKTCLKLKIINEMYFNYCLCGLYVENSTIVTQKIQTLKGCCALSLSRVKVVL